MRSDSLETRCRQDRRLTFLGLTDLSLRIINFGCGPSPAPGIRNIDGSPTVLPAHLPLPTTFGSRSSSPA